MAATLCENVNGQLKPVGGSFIEPFSYSYTPIGSIVPILGTTVPDGYLVCDGASYNIADYQELAAYFVDQFGSVNYFGGNGITTFEIPNITGAPSDVLSCIAVKNLYFANTGVTPSDSFVLRSQILTFNNENVAIVNAPNVTSDTFFFVFYHDSSRAAAQDAGITVRSGSGELIFTAESAPSGSIVCDVMCTNFEHQSGETITNEVIFDERGTEYVVGKYIYANGTQKPIYQKTIEVTIPTASTLGVPVFNYTSIGASIEKCLAKSGSFVVGTYTMNIPFIAQQADKTVTVADVRVLNNEAASNANTIQFENSNTNWSGKALITIQYTKTTDTPV